MTSNILNIATQISLLQRSPIRILRKIRMHDDDIGDRINPVKLGIHITLVLEGSKGLRKTENLTELTKRLF